MKLFSVARQGLELPNKIQAVPGGGRAGVAVRGARIENDEGLAFDVIRLRCRHLGLSRLRPQHDGQHSECKQAPRRPVGVVGMRG